jgi:hypothetical protein
MCLKKINTLLFKPSTPPSFQPVFVLQPVSAGSLFPAHARRSPATPGGPARPVQPTSARAHCQSLTGGPHPSSASSRRRTSLRPSRGRARSKPRLGVRAALPRAHGPARLGSLPYKAAAIPLGGIPRRQTLIFSAAAVDSSHCRLSSWSNRPRASVAR